jgi:hypothetical protein
MKKMIWGVVILVMLIAMCVCNDVMPNQPYVPATPSDTSLVRKKISVMGDSYSTFEGWSNRDVVGNANDYYVYYSHNSTRSSVDAVEKTWWYMLGEKPEFELEISNSFSGSVVSNTHYGGVDVAGTDLTFLHRIGKNRYGVDYNGKPDIILVFGGTNDCWAGVELGDYVYDDWTAEDLRCFRPALSKLLSSLGALYPDAMLCFITNSDTDSMSGLTKDYVKSIQNVCEHYGVTNIVLKHIEKVDGHPTYNGMKSICEQVYQVLKNEVH